ncbi:hypothetical protein [Aerolutibacter daejeonensis]|nr:hypothetical protein [Lysobacter daejeonensis]
MKPAYATAKLFALQPSRCNAQPRAHGFGARDDERARRIDT